MSRPGWEHDAGRGPAARPPALHEAAAGPYAPEAWGVAALAPAGHDLTWELAVELYEQAGNETVRVIEALAAVLVNRLREAAARASCSLACPGSLHVRPMPAARRGAPARPQAAEAGGAREPARRFEICRRIARRGLGGTLSDPTGGATAFHRHGEHPAWAENLLPVADAGPFLFYRA